MMRGMSRPDEALGQCAIVSTRVAKRHGLQLIRATGHTFPGREHWAVIQWDDDACNGEVIDLTARQFDGTVPATWRGALDDWLDLVCEWLADAIQYEVYLDPTTEVVAYRDLWAREDIDPEVAVPRQDGLYALLLSKRVT